MFGILTKPLWFLFILASLYGIAHIPIHERPLWWHAKRYMDEGWERSCAYIGEKKESLKESEGGWLKQLKKKKANNDAHKKKNLKKGTKEQILRSEEKELEKILEEHSHR